VQKNIVNLPFLKQDGLKKTKNEETINPITTISFGIC
jgi:hypothetical protein